MKKLFKLAAVTIALGCTANMATANDKVGFVEPNILMQFHPLAISEGEKFAQFMKTNEEKFAPQQKALDEESRKIADEEKGLLADRQKLENDAKALQKEQTSLEAAMKKEIAQLEKDAPRLRAKEIQARQDKINAKAKPFQNKVAAIQKREADFQKKAEAFQKKAEAFQKKAADFQAEFEKAQKEAGNLISPAELEKKVVDDINAKIKQVADEKGYTVILRPSMALYVKDESADITEAVLTAVGGKLPEPVKAEDAKAEEPKKEEVKSETKPEEAKQ